MRRLTMVMAILALAWSGVGWAADDQRVADTLAKNLKASEVLKGFQIKVQYREGTARLEGWVRNKQQLDEAVTIVNRSPEVERVINQLEIKANAAPAAPQLVPAAGQVVPATAQMVPASASRPQRLPPAPEGARTISPDSSGPSDQPVLRSALRPQRSPAQPAESKPAEFKPVTSGLSPLPPATLPVEGQRVGQRNGQMNGGQMSALRSVASISPAMPMPSNPAASNPMPSNATTSNSAMSSAPAEPARQIAPKPMSAAPKPMPMNSNVQRPNVQRAMPVQQVDENWGRSSAGAAPQASQNVPRRTTPMPNSQQQQMAYQQQYAQAAYAQQQYAQQQYQAYAQQQYARGYPQQYQMAAAYPQQPGPMPMGGAGAGPMPMPVPAHVPGVGGGPAPAMYDQPYMPNYAWPSYAAYPNYAAVSYPKQYSPTAWPYIGPFYPYPQVPLGWRKVTLEWDDGWWFLDFSDDRRHGCGR